MLAPAFQCMSKVVDAPVGRIEGLPEDGASTQDEVLARHCRRCTPLAQVAADEPDV